MPSPEIRPQAVEASIEALRLLTPAQAALVLSVPESWLRRKAGQRLIPSTRVGKHLRFSPADVSAIVRAGAQPVRQPRHSRRHVA